MSVKVEHVRAVLMALHDQLAWLQMPSDESDEHARYGFSVSYAMPVPDEDLPLSHWYTPAIEPPWQEPTSAQLRMCWTERLMSMP